MNCFSLLLPLFALAPRLGEPPAELLNVTATLEADDPFPAPTEGLTIPAPQEGGPTLLNVLGDFARVTGQNLHVSEISRELLRETPIGLLRGVEVPPGEVYSFVESLLWQSGFVVIDERDHEPRMLAIKALMSNERQRVRQDCVTVPAARLELYKRHPALMIQTVVELPEIDDRDLAKALRTFVVDDAVQRFAVIGDSVILVGTGRQVAHMAEVLRAVNELGGRPEGRRERKVETGEETEPDGDGR